MSSISLTDRMKTMARIDWSSPLPQPSPWAVVGTTVVALSGSLGMDALAVHLGTVAFPSTRGYVHFRFGDYATLTVIGVVAACAAWPVVTRISRAPRWLFLRLAAAVTLVLWIPDMYLLVRHQPVRAVAVLMVMHLVIAVVTYNALVRLAPPREGRMRGGPDGDGAESGSIYRLATALAVLVAVEFALGVATLVVTPIGRPTAWIPDEGAVLYLAHALMGLPLAAGAVLLVVGVGESNRLQRLSGWIGAAGVTLAGIGGLLAVSHPLRLVGVACMLVGPAVAAFGFLIPTFDRLGDKSSDPT